MINHRRKINLIYFLGRWKISLATDIIFNKNAFNQCYAYGCISVRIYAIVDECA